MSWQETFPLEGFGALILAMLFLGVEAGYRGRRWLLLKHGGEASGNDGQDQLLSAVLGLLALLLGFSFSLTLNRYEARRDLVTQEANAIGTVWLRAQLLEEPARGAMSALLRDYVSVRIDWSEADAAGGLEATNALQQRLWAVVGGVIRTESSAPLAHTLIESVNAAFDIASARAAARAAHIPDRVVHILILYAVLSMVMLGYIQGTSPRPHRIATSLLLILLTLSLTVILDLDRPRSGAIQVSQQPMEDLRASVR